MKRIFAKKREKIRTWAMVSVSEKLNARGREKEDFWLRLVQQINNIIFIGLEYSGKWLYKTKI